MDSCLRCVIITCDILNLTRFASSNAPPSRRSLDVVLVYEAVWSKHIPPSASVSPDNDVDCTRYSTTITSLSPHSFSNTNQVHRTIPTTSLMVISNSPACVVFGTCLAQSRHHAALCVPLWTRHTPCASHFPISIVLRWFHLKAPEPTHIQTCKWNCPLHMS